MRHGKYKKAKQPCRQIIKTNIEDAKSNWGITVKIKNLENIKRKPNRWTSQ